MPAALFAASETPNTEPQEPQTPGTLDTEAPFTELKQHFAKSTLFRLAWDKWLKHCKSKRRRVTPEALQEHAEMLAAMSAENATAAIKHAIAQDYMAPALPKPGRAGAAEPKPCKVCGGSGRLWVVRHDGVPVATDKPDCWEGALTVHRVSCGCKGNANTVEVNYGFRDQGAAESFVAACEFMRKPIAEEA